jgi:predicted AlkP superfamily pyrophosphatase or phosphodiesterase
MNLLFLRVVLSLVLMSGLGFAQQHRKLVVISVDGLDHRYLRDRDKLKLKIPNIRRLLAEGAAANGVIGVVPTVTWPSHTTMLAGVPPAVHGILNNRRPKDEGGDYYWETSSMKVRSLWHAARDKGLTTAAITWPVSVGGPITWNLPEYFQGRNGGGMDFASIASKSTPGLIDDMLKQHPSIQQEWMDDRTRTLATVYLLKTHKPDLLTLHFVDLDSEQHAKGPFSADAFRVLELTDQFIGDILKALPPDVVVALVSDHGFAPAKKAVSLPLLAKQQGRQASLDTANGLVLARDEDGRRFLQEIAKVKTYGIGRMVPQEELRRFAPSLASALVAYEPAEGFIFAGPDAKEVFSAPKEKGVHGLWPLRPDYRAIFILWGKGIRRESLGEIEMTSIASRFASVLGLAFKPGEPVTGAQK